MPFFFFFLTRSFISDMSGRTCATTHFHSSNSQCGFQSNSFQSSSHTYLMLTAILNEFKREIFEALTALREFGCLPPLVEENNQFAWSLYSSEISWVCIWRLKLLWNLAVERYMFGKFAYTSNWMFLRLHWKRSCTTWDQEQCVTCWKGLLGSVAWVITLAEL